jgi:endonuclease/exonuclease/phosphatase (EEP) superfamily protein YafD
MRQTLRILSAFFAAFLGIGTFMRLFDFFAHPNPLAFIFMLICVTFTWMAYAAYKYSAPPEKSDDE